MTGTLVAPRAKISPKPEVPVFEIAARESQMNTLVMMHFPNDTGYALGALKKIFFKVASNLGGADAVYFSFPEIRMTDEPSLVVDSTHALEFDLRNPTSEGLSRLSEFVSRNGITHVLAFDLAPGSPVHRCLRKAGVMRIVAYFGAPMGSIQKGWSLWLRRMRTAPHAKADLYVFESIAMQDSAIFGRGLRPGRTTVIRTGLDLDRFRPGSDSDADAVRREFGIPRNRRIVFYAGHMEPRKGVATIIDAARELVDHRGFPDVHFLLCGDRPGESDQFLDRLEGSKALGHVTFAGYRGDIPRLMAGSTLGVIASTGWDSFPRSAMEMSASGLPLVASSLQGLVETVEHGTTGYLFEPGAADELASRIEEILNDPGLLNSMKRASREMAERRYSEDRQVRELQSALMG